MAGPRFNTAVPEVVTTPTGPGTCCARRPLAIPKARNPADRSSMRTWAVMMPCRSSSAKAYVSGADLEPGHTTTCFIPKRTQSRAISRAVAVEMFTSRFNHASLDLKHELSSLPVRPLCCATRTSGTQKRQAAWCTTRSGDRAVRCFTDPDGHPSCGVCDRHGAA